MKKINTFLLFAHLIGFAQIHPDSFLTKMATISSVEQAEKLLEKDSTISGQVVTINQHIDTTNLARHLFQKERLYTFSFKIENQRYSVKVLEKKKITLYRVSYIYLNHDILSLKEIDSLRALIMRRLEKGEDFSVLASEYSMDGNSKRGGDLGWFEKEMMMKEFERATIKHKKGEVYTVDIPSKKWFYVVKKTFDPFKTMQIKYLIAIPFVP